MTKEIRYIIETKKFKRRWDDYFTYWEFFVPMLMTIAGVVFLVEGGEIRHYIFGTILILSAFSLTKFMFVRLRQLNGFDELENKRTNEANFDLVIQSLKALNIVEMDKDIHNFTINAKYRSALIPPLYEWLTIVCVDDKILINSRPSPTTIMFWFRRNAMIEFIKCMSRAGP